MNMLIKKTLLLFISLTMVLLSGASAFATKTLTVGTASVNSKGDEASRTIELDVTASNFEDVNGVAFTLTYDADAIEFIGLVQSQKPIDNSDHAGEASPPSPETIAQTIYYQTNDSTPGKVLVAAAGAEYFAPSSADDIPFRLKFKVKLSTPSGDYPIGLQQTVIDTVAAGEKLPVAAGLAPGAAPESATHFDVTLVSGTIRVFQENEENTEPVVIVDKPESTVTIPSGSQSDTFTVSGGDSGYTWSVAGPVPVAETSGETFHFNAPESGSFAGEYVITVKDSAGTNTDSFKVYVPLTIEPDDTQFAVLENDPAQSFTVRGAAPGTGYTVTIDSLDDDAADQVVSGTFSETFEAEFSFDPASYADTVSVETGTRQYTVDFQAEAYVDLPQIDFSILPLTDFSGIVVDNNGNIPLDGALVTITTPAAYAGQSVSTLAGTGKFVFANLPGTLLDGSTAVYGFKVEKEGYLATTFQSSDLSNDGSSTIAMEKSYAHISGTITNPGDAVCTVVLLDKDTIVAGPIDALADGTFTFSFETAPALPANYTVKAGKPGWSGSVGIIVEAFDYKGIEVTIEQIAKDIPDVAGDSPTNGRGVIDGELGGAADLTGDDGLDDGVKSAFGANKIEVMIMPQANAGIVNVALPTNVATEALKAPSAPETAIKWEINGLEDRCAIIPVPFALSDADKVKNGSLVALYARESAPDTWKVADTEGEIDYIGDGTYGIIHAKICGWSANSVGVGAVPGTGDDTDNTDSGGGGGGCFISMLSGRTSGNGSGFGGILLTILLAGSVLFWTHKTYQNRP